MANRNRTAGHSFECKVAAMFRAAGFEHVVTSRSESKSRDDAKIDLINKNEADNGRLPYDVQCKCVRGRVKYDVLLKEIKGTGSTIKVVVHQSTTRKIDKNKKISFHPVGEYAIVHLEDFMALLKKEKEWREIAVKLARDSGQFDNLGNMAG